MTCASCAVRIENGLNRLDGVDAAVNLATEQATVDYDGSRVQLEELIGAVEAAGYEARVGVAEEEEDGAPGALRRRLLVAAILTVPLVFVSMIPQFHFESWEWLAFAFATPIVFYSGAGFHRAALANLRHGAVSMDTLISIGTLAAWLWSIVALLAVDEADVYFEVAGVITTLILVGRYLEARAKGRASEAIRSLLKLGAKDARVLVDGDEEIVVPIENLRVGDRFVVRPGEKIATDGVVEEGRSAVDQSMLTGEPIPIEVEPGSSVAGATINSSGRLIVLATKVGAETALAQITRLVAQAQAGKAPIQRLSDRVSGVFVPIVVAISLATLIAWLAITSDASTAFTAAVAVLIIACPCALGLATPTAIMVGTGRGAQLGILIRGPEVLEGTRRITTVVLDKTGTVTEGQLRLTDVIPASGVSREEILRLTGSAENASEHPIARAIADRARIETGPLAAAHEFRAVAGLGIEAVVDGHSLVVGRPTLLADWGLELPTQLVRASEQAESHGQTTVAVSWDGEVRGLLVLTDRIKVSSQAAVDELKALGLTPVLLSGDNELAARTVADRVGIDRVRAQVLPEDKVREIRTLQTEHEVVAMVGDGLNDAPALAQADLGLAIGTGTDVAIEASDITLVSGDLRAAGDAIALSRRTLRTIKQNLFWAFAYNVAAIPLAVVGVLDPIVAAAAMAFSSIFVVTNSLRLRRFRSSRGDLDSGQHREPTPNLQGEPA